MSETGPPMLKIPAPCITRVPRRQSVVTAEGRSDLRRDNADCLPRDRLSRLSESRSRPNIRISQRRAASAAPDCQQGEAMQRRVMSAHRVVIVGGGFGGLQAARGLRGAPVEITLIDRRNFHLFQPLSYQVATGALPPGEVAYPLRAM